MRPENINTVCHRWILEVLPENAVCVDATMGNGNDTLFLAEHAKKVYAFDIQSDALKNSQQKCKDYHNIEYFLKSHAEMDEVISEEVDLVVFNLGYLPKGDESITSKAESSMLAIKKALQLCNTHGSVLIAFYIGHPEGLKEYQTFMNAQNEFKAEVVRTYTYIDRKDAPILVHLKRNS